MGIHSFYRLRFFTLLSVYLFLFSAHIALADNTIPNPQDTSSKSSIKKVKLVIDGTGVTTFPTGVDHATNHAAFTFILPKKEGKITIKGHYTIHGSFGNYTLSGPSYQYGYIKNHELVITAAEDFFNGESMKRIEVQPNVHIPLKNGTKVTYDFHHSVANAHCDCTATYRLKLKEKEKWRFSIFQKDSLLRSYGEYHIGIDARIRTDIDIEIEDGKFKKAQSKASFTSIKTVSTPPGLADCTIQNYGLRHTSYPISGAVTGKSVRLEVTPENRYTVTFDCLIDKDKLKDEILDKMDANRKGNKIKIMHHKAKRNGSDVTIETTWETKVLTDKQLKGREKSLKDQANTIVSSKLQYYRNKVTAPMYPHRSERTIMVPLKNFSKDSGTLQSGNFLRIRMQKTE